jgi:FkbM family methyltransferase
MRTLATLTGRLVPVMRGLVEKAWAALGRRQIQKSEPAAAVLTNVSLNTPSPIKHYVPSAEYIRQATEEDIYYCFRLLLGRCPNPEEWPGHSSRAGEDIENVVSSFVTSREFAERGLTTRTYREKVELAHLPRFSVYVSGEDLAIGHHVLRGHPYDPGIGIIMERYVKPGMSVVDIGANVGCLTMLMASLVGPNGLVVAVEPNPENIKLLEASRRVNGFNHVLVIQAAAGRQASLLALNVSYSNGMTGELPRNLEALFGARTVPCFALDTVLPKNRQINLFKVDTEGAELNVLIGLSETIENSRPIIISEFSPTAMPGISHCTGPEYLSFLVEKGYQIGVIEKDGAESMFGDDIDGVMRAYLSSGIDHIDIIAVP